MIKSRGNNHRQAYYVYRNLFILCTIFMYFSCTNTDNSYSYRKLTPQLINELGGIDSLSRYQFYLSNSFELLRVENEKSFTNLGYIDNLDKNFKIKFDMKTPGIFKDAEMDGNNIKCINILFDKNNNDYLTFAQANDSYSNEYYHVAHSDWGIKVESCFWDNVDYRSLEYKYKGSLWNKRIISSKSEDKSISYIKNTYLIIRIKNTSITTIEEAKGRLVSE